MQVRTIGDMVRSKEYQHMAIRSLARRERLQRVIAQIDVTLSNSMIESWWRSLKRSRLYINRLDNVATVRETIRTFHNAIAAKRKI